MVRVLSLYPNRPELETDILSLLLDIQLIQDELINILIAGRDTTASCIAFVVYFLTQHPDVLARLSEEVHSVLASEARSTPSLESLKGMHYLRAVVDETLRLFPSVPFNARDAVSERVLETSDGTCLYLPAGAAITYSPLHLHRNPNYWGPTAACFDPVRFLPRDKGGDGRFESYLLAHGRERIFVPFNGGPRKCLGQEFAYAEVEVFLCRLVQRLRKEGRRVDSSDQSSAAASTSEAGWGLRLDEEAVPKECRVPKEWSESPVVLPPALAVDLPLHHGAPFPPAAAGAIAVVPAMMASGESPRKRIERVWPKSHLTMFVEGGVWIRT